MLLCVLLPLMVFPLIPVAFVLPKNCDLKCNLNEVTARNCTSCECQNKYFRNRRLGSCYPCKKMCNGEMEVIIEECGEEKDAKCGTCPIGTFYTPLTGCNNCSVCPYGVLRNCTLDKDAECIKKTTTVPSATEPKIEVNTAHNKWFHIAISSFVVIGCLLLIVVCLSLLLCREKKYKRCNFHDNSSAGTEDSNLNLYPQSVPYNYELTEEELATKINTLPGDYAEQLGYLLNPHCSNNWATLAGVIGFTQLQIANIRDAGCHNNQGSLQCLLLQWSSRDVATVGNLRSALRKIKRDDCCRVLCSFMVKKRQVEERDDHQSQQVPTCLQQREEEINSLLETAGSGDLCSDVM